MCSRKDSVMWVTQLPLFPEPSVVGWYSSPLKVHILILRTCDYVALYNKRGFEDVIKLSILRWNDYPRLPGWVINPVTSILKKRRHIHSKGRCSRENGGRDQCEVATSWCIPGAIRKDREGFSLQDFRESLPANILILDFWTLEL